MAKHSDIKLTATGLPAGTVSGVSITYQVGSVPTAAVDMVPPSGGGGKISGGFGNIDDLKRKGEVVINVSVNSHSGVAGMTSRSLKFVGLLDGMSISNLVGGNSYQAIVKNKAQRLLELTTITPGLYPTSVNPYKMVDHGIITNGQGGESSSGKVIWDSLAREIDSRKSPLLFYTDLMRLVLAIQTGKWAKFVGTDGVLDGERPLEAIFGDKRYQAALKEAKTFFDDIDISAVNGGAVGKTTTGNEQIMSAMQSMFAQGSTVLLENYSNFLSSLGCSLIFGNSKMFVVPQNSVIKQSTTIPGKGEMQKTPNNAGPADYGGYNYTDNGYRDVSMVIVMSANFVGGNYIGSAMQDTGGLAYFAEEEGLSEASGVLTVNAHPWMSLSVLAPAVSDSKEANQDFDDKAQSLHGRKMAYADTVSKTAKNHAKRAETKKAKVVEGIKDILKNYAETKFYQVRYQDRHGSITMDFNPNWVPGTGGSLYIRETGTFAHFYVNSVTHRIDTSAPNHGAAMTIVNFNCGRMGPSPVGAKEDKFLGYTRDMEQYIQQKFIDDTL